MTKLMKKSPHPMNPTHKSQTQPQIKMHLNSPKQLKLSPLAALKLNPLAALKLNHLAAGLRPKPNV